MRPKPVQITDTLVMLALVALAWGIAGWVLAAPAILVGILLMRRTRRLPAESGAEAAEGRQRTYAQFQKDLNDPTGAAGIALLRDVD